MLFVTNLVIIGWVHCRLIIKLSFYEEFIKKNSDKLQISKDKKHPLIRSKRGTFGERERGQTGQTERDKKHDTENHFTKGMTQKVCHKKHDTEKHFTKSMTQKA